MAQINQKLLAKIVNKLRVGKSRSYAIIDATARRTNLPTNVAALIVARDAGIGITRFASNEDWNLIRGVLPSAVSATPTVPVAAPAMSRSTRRERSRTTPSKKPRGNKVWVVYGRDDRIKKSLFELLRSMGLHPIEWNSALESTKQGSPSIADVLEAGFRNAVATVVLFTPDDEGKLKTKFIQKDDPSHERRVTGQSRQNVVFEAGMAFGRHPERTILVEVGKTRPISDLAGRHTVRLAGSITSRQQLLVKLRAVGCPVDDSGDWHTAGDFTLK